MQDNYHHPFPFYLCGGTILLLGLQAWRARISGWGLPLGMVLFTVTAWYLGDAVYNGTTRYRYITGDQAIADAWWQVWFFLMFLSVCTPILHRIVNRDILNRPSQIMLQIGQQRFRTPQAQNYLDTTAIYVFSIWTLLMTVALIKVNGDFLGLFAPYMGHKANPWGRGQIGGGISALLSLASYVQLFLTSSCGVIAALSTRRRTLFLALIICALALPPYIFDRTRNLMIAVVLPGFLAAVLVRFRGGWIAKSAILVGAFMIVNLWFHVVMANRSGMRFDISGALSMMINREGGTSKHEGLNMFEELVWIGYLENTGAYSPNWGERYFAELVNPIPRGLWPNKPTIGLDYAVARGQLARGGNGEVTATVATGMIGQGVVNFGPIFGPVAAAFLVGCWIALLSRQDLLGTNPARLLLYASGFVLTFNLGRDITLLVLYPFLFGLIIIRILPFLQNTLKAKP